MLTLRIDLEPVAQVGQIPLVAWIEPLIIHAGVDDIKRLLPQVEKALCRFSQFAVENTGIRVKADGAVVSTCKYGQCKIVVDSVMETLQCFGIESVKNAFDTSITGYNYLYRQVASTVHIYSSKDAAPVYTYRLPPPQAT